MVIIHIAHINESILGGVQIAVPQMIRAQSQYATVGCINTTGFPIDGVQMLPLDRFLCFSPPFDHPDLIVFHEVYRFEFIKMYKSLQHAQIPYIIVPHGCLSKQAQKRKFLKKAVANFLFFGPFVSSCAALQYLSENEKNMSIVKRHCSFTSGNGIQLPIEQKNGFEKDHIQFLYIGRLEIKTKGLDLLLAAVTQCQNLMRESNATLLIYGPNYHNEHKVLRNTIKTLGISDIVHINGAITLEQKKYILLSSDCFIQASRTEGLPMGPIEAMSYGLPCIVTRGVGLGDLIEQYNGGLQCEISSHGLSQAIQYFIKNPDQWNLMSTAARKLAKRYFDKNTIAKQAVEQYRQIIR